MLQTEQIQQLRQYLRQCAVHSSGFTGDDETDNEKCRVSLNTDFAEIPDLVSDRFATIECRITQLELAAQQARSLLETLQPAPETVIQAIQLLRDAVEGGDS